MRLKNSPLAECYGGILKLPIQVGVGYLDKPLVLRGIGFSMSLFIGSPAFREAGIGYNRTDRIGIICGSVLAGIAGFILPRRTLPKSAA